MERTQIPTPECEKKKMAEINSKIWNSPRNMGAICACDISLLGEVFTKDRSWKPEDLEALHQCDELFDRIENIVKEKGW